MGRNQLVLRGIPYSTRHRFSSVSHASFFWRWFFVQHNVLHVFSTITCRGQEARASEREGLAHQSNEVGSIFWTAIDGSIHSEDCTIAQRRGGRGGEVCSSRCACGRRYDCISHTQCSQQHQAYTKEDIGTLLDTLHETWYPLFR